MATRSSLAETADTAHTAEAPETADERAAAWAPALADLHHALHAAAAAAPHPDSIDDASAALRALLGAVAQADALVCGLVAAVDREGLWRGDGYRSVRDWLKHAGRLSGSEAWGYATVAAARQRLPHASAGHDRGHIGCAQIRALASVAANPRVADADLDDGDRLLTEDATQFDFEDFMVLVRRFVELADPDGSRQGGEACHRRRNVTLGREFDGGWHLRGSFGDLDGARLQEIFLRFLEAETLRDWDDARARLGGAATAGDLARTTRQRRADALVAIFTASDAPGGASGADPAVCVVVDQRTLEDELQRQFGVTAPARRPVQEYRTMRCETLDGDPLHPADALALALIGQLRRVVYDTASVVIDLGTSARFFRGNAALAARLAAARCYWPGCHVPSSRCQIDHLTRFGPRGPTDQRNAGPCCGRHNRHKFTHQFNVRRNDAGQWALYRPDGSLVV